MLFLIPLTSPIFDPTVEKGSMHVDGELMLYMTDTVFALTAMGCMLVYRYCRDISYPIMAVVLTASAVTSFCMNMWWPLAVSAVLFAALLWLGSGALTRNRSEE